jgi:hypothetical protein
MKRFHFLAGLLIFAWLLSACQSPQRSVAERAIPSPSVYCDGRIAWSAEVTTDDVVGYTTFWIAFDIATAQDLFSYLQVDVTLDGESLSNEMKFMQAAEPYSVTCTDSGQQFEASRVRYTLILPPLSSEEHILRWNYTITADLTDGAFHDLIGMTGEYAITLNPTSRGG